MNAECYIVTGFSEAKVAKVFLNMTEDLNKSGETLERIHFNQLKIKNPKTCAEQTLDFFIKTLLGQFFIYPEQSYFQPGKSLLLWSGCKPDLLFGH